MFEEDLNKIFTKPEKENFNHSEYVVDNSEIDRELGDFLSGKFKRGLGIGFSGYDKYILLKENQLWASTGKKGGGKTTITQINYLMWSICHGIKCVVAYQENDDWHVKFNMLSMLLGCDRSTLEGMYKKNDTLYLKALDWINKHYIFINVKTIKEATQVTESLVNEGHDIHTLILDPANSFLSGFSNTGNERTDHTITAIEVLDFSKRVCSVHVSQHPIMSVQRDQTRDVTSYDAENGVYLNKAHGTYTINRDKGTSSNRIAIDNERTTHMGGGQTHPEEPLIMEWRPNGIDIISNGEIYRDVIQTLRYRHNPLNEDIINQLSGGDQPQKEIPKATLSEAFGEDNGIDF